MPIWWSEAQLSPLSEYGSLSAAASATTQVLQQLADSGAAVALLWCDEDCPTGDDVWTSTLQADGGGEATPIYDALINAASLYRGGRSSSPTVARSPSRR